MCLTTGVREHNKRVRCENKPQPLTLFPFTLLMFLPVAFGGPAKQIVGKDCSVQTGYSRLVSSRNSSDPECSSSLVSTGCLSFVGHVHKIAQFGHQSLQLHLSTYPVRVWHLPSLTVASFTCYVDPFVCGSQLGLSPVERRPLCWMLNAALLVYKCLRTCSH